MDPETLVDVLDGLDGDASLCFLKNRGKDQFTLSYRDLKSLIRKNAVHMRTLGLKPGDKVALCLQTSLEHIVTFLALVYIGAVPVSIKPKSAGQRNYVAYVNQTIEASGARYVYHDLPTLGVTKVKWEPDQFQAGSLEQPGRVLPSDIAFVQFTSGSTSAPKPVEISHANLLSNINAIHGADGRLAGTTQGFNFLPLNHDMGLIGGLLSNLVTQNPLALCSVEEFVRNPVSYLNWIYRNRVEVTAMPNFILRLLSVWLRKTKPDRSPYFRSVKTIYCGAEAIVKSDVERFVESAAPFGLDPGSLFFCYGLAECTLIVSGRRYRGSDGDFVKTKSGRYVANVGRSVAGTSIAIRNVDPVSGVGEICVAGPSVTGGGVDKSRSLSTGDLGFLQAGDLHVTGRKKDVIIVNGINVYLQDIEEFVREAEGIKACAAIPEGDSFYVLIVPRPGHSYSESELNKKILGQLGCLAKQVVAVKSNDFRYTTSGKLDRRGTLMHLRASGYVLAENMSA